MIDAPWPTRSDAIEDELSKLRAQLRDVNKQLETARQRESHLRQQFDSVHTQRMQLETQRAVAQHNLDRIHARIARGVPADGSTRHDLLKSKRYGLAGCTDYVATKRDVTSFLNSHGQPGHPGNACQWDNQAQKAGFEVGTHPVKGSVMAFERGVLGVDKKAGHVAYVEKISRVGHGYVISTSEADTVKNSQGEVIRGTHSPVHHRQYYMERQPDGSHKIWRWAHGKRWEEALL